MLRDEKGRFIKEEETTDYGFYSNVLKKVFSTLDELKEAEKKHRKEKETELKANEEKKLFAKRVEGLYKNYLDVADKANKQIAEAHDAYLKARKEFIDKYHSYHMSYYKDDDKSDVVVSDVFNSLSDIFQDLFKLF